MQTKPDIYEHKPKERERERELKKEKDIYMYSILIHKSTYLFTCIQ